MTRFLDADVLVRYLVKPATAKEQRRAELARDLLLRVERGEERVVTSPLVVFETVLTLDHAYGASRDEIQRVMSELLSLRGIRLRGKRACREALELFAQSDLSFSAAHKVVSMQDQGVSEIYSSDAGFDRVAGIRRIEP